MDALFPIEIEPGLLMTDLKTVEQCDQVFDRITYGITRIEQQLARPPSANEPPDWRPRAKAALRHKKMALPRIQQHRAWIRREEKRIDHAETVRVAAAATTDKRRVLLEIAREIAPDMMNRAQSLAEERRPDLFGLAGEPA